MKRAHCIVCFLTALVAVWLTALTNWQEQDTCDKLSIQQNIESVFQNPNHQIHHEATLTDAAQIYRICSSRPQRNIPTQDSRCHRMDFPSYGSTRRHITNLLYSYHDSRWSLKSHPICLSVSCDYYVIALRHIIR